MARTALRVPLLGAARRSPLDDVPGSNSILELVRLLRDARRFLHERFDRHGRIFRTRLAYPVVFVVGEEANKSVLVTRRAELSFGLGYAQTAVKRVFEGSIMLQDGEAHGRTRDILAPAVGKLAIRECSATVHAIWSRAANRAAANGPVDAYALTERTTFEVAANVLTGLELAEETEAFRPLFERLIAGIMAPVPLRVPLGKLDRALRARAELARLLRPRIEAARNAPPRGLLGQLAHHHDADGRWLPIEEITQHLLLLFWAGYDTTASAGSWVLHELAQRADWQERLRAELASVLGDDPARVRTLDRERTQTPNAPEETKALEQTTWFLQEVERMYPSALFFPRIAIEDFPFAGFVVPRGTPVFYSPYLSHRDPATWDRPNVFDPDRWSPARERRAVVARLVGFGGGPRVCLGKPFARQQLKLMLHAILARYRVDPDPTSAPWIRSLPVHHPERSRVVLTPLERN
jgi:cytochrome P450